ncbi:UNVERIFIED_CONTAM: hypothetical protein NCL1_23201 [Trichonephila clavipes]
MVYLKRFIEESGVFKEDYEFVKTVIGQVLEESETQKFKPKNQIELERLKLERVKAELKLAKLRNSANTCEISLNTCDTEMCIDEDMELPQDTEEVLPIKSERAHMFSVVPGAVAQTVIVGEKRGLPRNSSNEPLISADEMSGIEVEKSKLCKRKLKKSGRMTVEGKQKVRESSIFKASSDVIFVPCHLCFKRNYSQVKERRCRKTCAETVFYPTIWCFEKATNNAKKVRLKSRMSDIDSRKYQKSVLNGMRPFMEICVQEKSAKEKFPLIRHPSLDGCEVKSDPKSENDRGP